MTSKYVQFLIPPLPEKSKKGNQICKKVLFDKTTFFETGPGCFEILKSLNLELKVDTNVRYQPAPISNFGNYYYFFFNNCEFLPEKN